MSEKPHQHAPNVGGEKPKSQGGEAGASLKFLSGQGGRGGRTVTGPQPQDTRASEG